MEGFTKDVIDYMNQHPDAVIRAMAGAVTICQKGAIDLMADDGMEKAHQHIFRDECPACRKLFLILLRSDT